MKIPNWLRLVLLSPSVLAIAVATRLLLMANLDPMAAMKIATTGGLVGTLVGTIVPLLPPFLPLFVVWLVIARRYFLALMAAFSTVLVAPAKVTAAGGWHYISGRGWTFLSDQFTEPGLWIVALLSLAAALASLPKSLRWEREDALFKKVDEKVKEHEDEAITINAPVMGRNRDTDEYEVVKWKSRLYAEATPQERKGWRVCLRDELREIAKRRRWWKLARCTLYVLVVAAISVPTVGTIAQFYAIPATGSDPAFIACRPWVPPEVLTTKSGRREVGYVLATADKWFTVLAEKDRTIHYVAADDVMDRAVCTLDTALSPNIRPLMPLHGTTGTSSKPCPTAP